MPERIAVYIVWPHLSIIRYLGFGVNSSAYNGELHNSLSVIQTLAEDDACPVFQ